MLIDAFIFFDEKELVKLRVEYLSSIVDYFVVVEANITHQGRDKEWNFEKEDGCFKNYLKQFLEINFKFGLLRKILRRMSSQRVIMMFF